MTGRRARRLLAVLGVVAAAAVAGAPPASAHSVGGVSATNYRSELTAMTPSTPGVRVNIVDLGAKLELVNETGEDVVVLGYQDEPYLRVGPGGVYENRRSPSLYQNKTRSSTDALITLPPEADPAAAPEWHRRGGGDRVSWSDHRARWEGADPPAVKSNPGQAQTVVSRWAIALEKGPARESIVVTGRIAWIPGPGLAPWFVAMLVLFGATLAAGASKRWPVLLSAALALLVAADAVRFYGSATSHGGSVVSGLLRGAALGSLELAALAVGAWCVGAVQRRRPVGLYLAMAVGLVIGFLSGVGDLLNLAYSQVPSALPASAARAAMAVCLGMGLGLVGASFLALRQMGPLLANVTVSAKSSTFRPTGGST